MAFNWGQGLSGGLGGAGTGAQIGSAFGPVGTGVGAGIGAVTGLASGFFGNDGSPKPLTQGTDMANGTSASPMANTTQLNQPSSFWSGSQGTFGQAPRFTPDQQNIMQQLMKMGFEGFNPQAMEASARKNFMEQTVPGIANQFTNQSGGALSSPSLMSQLGQGGANLEADIQRQQMEYMLPLLQLGLQPNFDTFFAPGQPGAGHGISQGIGSGIAAGAKEGFPAIIKMIRDAIASRSGGQGGQGGAGQAVQQLAAPSRQIGTPPAAGTTAGNLNFLSGNKIWQ